MLQRAQRSGSMDETAARPSVIGIFSLLLAAGSFLAFPACSHYQLGTKARLTFATLYVAPIENRAMVPQAQAIVATALRDALSKDGRLTLAASPEAADATLHVTLVGYEREVAAASATDTGLARKFALNLRAACTLTDNRTGQPLFTNRPIRVTRDAFTDSGQLQAEYQTLPLLAGALADKVAHAVLDVW
jgi:hypothetical protein